MLHVDTEVGARGGQRQLALLLAHRTHDAVVAAPSRADWANALPVSVHRIGFVGRMGGRRALRNLASEVRPDVIAAHTHHALALAVGLAPLVVHRRLDFPPSRASVRRYSRVRSVVAVSGAVARVLRAAGVEAPIHVVRDAVIPFPLAPLPEGPPHLVAVGALVDHKGHEDLVRAMTDLPGVTLTIAGEGLRRRRLETQVARAGLDHRVRLPGQVADIRSLLRTAHVFVHPSREEGLGQAVIEALTMGRPVVATRAGGLPETVQDLGWLVPPRCPAALTAALRTALREVDAARATVIAARDRMVARHDVTNLVVQTESAYRAAAR